jgi:hypothetical protein
MQTVMSAEIQNNPHLTTAVQRANDILRGELGPSEPVVTTKWGISKDMNRGTLIDLEIADPIARVNAQFLPKELNKNGDRLLVRLRHLWMDLLSRRFDIHFAQTLKAVAAALDGGA